MSRKRGRPQEEAPFAGLRGRDQPAGAPALQVYGTAVSLLDRGDDDGAPEDLERVGVGLLCAEYGGEAVTLDRFDARLALGDGAARAPSAAGRARPAADEEEAWLERERWRDLPVEHGGRGPSPPAPPSDCGGSEDDEPAGAGGAAVPFSYSGGEAEPPAEPPPLPRVPVPGPGEPAFAPRFALPAALAGAALPATRRHFRVIERTAAVVAAAAGRGGGAQLEVVLRVRHAGDALFGFLLPGDALHPFFRWLVGLPPEARAEVAAAGGADGDGGALGLLGQYSGSDGEGEEEAGGGAEAEAVGAGAEAGAPAVAEPPQRPAPIAGAELERVMRTTAAYARRGGARFHALAAARAAAGDARLAFLRPDDPNHAAYLALLAEAGGGGAAEPAAAPGAAAGGAREAPPEEEEEEETEEERKKAERRRRARELLARKAEEEARRAAEATCAAEQERRRAEEERRRAEEEAAARGAGERRRAAAAAAEEKARSLARVSVHRRAFLEDDDD